MKTALLLLLVFLSLVSYSALALLLGVQQHYPIIHILAAVVVLVIMAKQLKEKFGIPKLAANVAGWALVGLFSWWTLIYSEYEPAPNDPVGSNIAASLAELPLTDQDGNPWSAATALVTNEATLFVFFRGHW